MREIQSIKSVSYTHIGDGGVGGNAGSLGLPARLGWAKPKPPGTGGRVKVKRKVSKTYLYLPCQADFPTSLLFPLPVFQRVYQRTEPTYPHVSSSSTGASMISTSADLIVLAYAEHPDKTPVLLLH